MIDPQRRLPFREMNWVWVWAPLLSVGLWGGLGWAIWRATH